MIAIDTRDFCIPSDENDYDELVAFADIIARIQTHEVIPIDVLDKIRIEIEDYITHSPYIKSFMDCCRLRDDVMRIIDKYKTENEDKE